MTLQDLQRQIEQLSPLTVEQINVHRDVAFVCITRLRLALNHGEVRAAEPDASSPNGWRANAWVKQGILLAFRLGRMQEIESGGDWHFFDKDTVPLRGFRVEDGVRIVPGGTAVRDGVFLAPGVIMMPPSYVNIGAHVGAGTMIDSHALVGSCAQVGERVHVSAAAQIGGVLEPAGALPVIIEDDVLMGGNTGVYEGCIVKRRAVLATGVVLTGSTPLYDLVNSRVVARPSPDEPLVVPEGAVVVSGSRSIVGKSEFAREQGLSLYAPIIIKYRDEKTDARTALESALR
ncbi:MAG: 2,3,4,5-tetrahydropyridine-2,6-dicarboxylate N-succinyltransferase [Bacteroidota bacterium]|nr:2,3,4,5-tetrahydropyridine-2,6-dicarboxylate N-succinyltransferase [Bacteroidota bacterium]MDP4232556.1 2,3,4,5-tetrahydropyridine-2,6-dicarboxylate N-succinyltransferase [Bacteroidota bacterium]MDP4242989.1 2,3,4,5-tetrahydropyridine-2,6-dicarboxylate N-succinyltransferase [Bacteroidota bacterium]MDP4286436.1 2,3,4,5-tetrahydropyridine-2,6-dicarboxylate N-succinyltransferase [Bacteroidota bacterium]